MSELDLATAVKDPAIKALFEKHVTELRINAVPEEFKGVDSYSWDVTIAQKSPGRWAVSDRLNQYDAKKRTGYESLPSSRTDAFKKRFRHSLEDAVKLANEIAPTIIVMGLSPAGYAKWEEARQIMDARKNAGEEFENYDLTFVETIESLNPDEHMLSRLEGMRRRALEDKK